MVDEIIDGRGNRIFTSRLTLVELTSVAAIKVRTGAMTAEAAGKSLSTVAECHKSRQFIAHGVVQEDYDRAQLLLNRHAQQNRLRTLDSLQLASAIRWRAKSGIDFFVTADRALAGVAVLEGFAILIPEDV